MLVTNVTYPMDSIAPLYRNWADCVDLEFCQHGFDELKNQWGLSGFPTQDIKRCQTTA